MSKDEVLGFFSSDHRDITVWAHGELGVLEGN